MMFLAQFRLGEFNSQFVNGSLILMVILVLMYSIMGLIRKSATWGFATSFFIFLLWGIVSYYNFNYSIIMLPCIIKKLVTTIPITIIGKLYVHKLST